jgi:hypothetical protein
MRILAYLSLSVLTLFLIQCAGKTAPDGQEMTNNTTDVVAEATTTPPAAPLPATEVDRAATTTPQPATSSGQEQAAAPQQGVEGAKITNVTLSANPQPTSPKPAQKLSVTENTAPAPPAPAPKVSEAEALPPTATLDHSTWDQLLRTYVSSSGQVNYSGLKSAVGQLDGYLELLKANVPAADWGKNQTMAYWINAYNAFTVKLILDNYPLSSIKDIDNGSPWDRKWINIGGKTYSLNQIENDILRARYNDPRIHFAVNCAAASCPPLYNRAFTTDNLVSVLNARTNKFINDAKYNTLTNEAVAISKIFDWYGTDFGKPLDYIRRYTSQEISPDAKVTFREYDWQLNGR